MRYMLFAAAVLLPAIGNAAAPESFEHEGQHYTYTVAETPKGRVITGQRADGTNFRFVVGDKRVRGTVDGAAVAFRLSDVKPAAITVAR